MKEKRKRNRRVGYLMCERYNFSWMTSRKGSGMRRSWRGWENAIKIILEK